MVDKISRELGQIPEPEDFEAKEVYAFFGLAAYLSQCLERGLINLAVVLHARGLSKITREAFEEAFNKMEKRMLGQLMLNVRQNITVPDGLEAALDKALVDRNYLTHHFFASHDINFNSNVGRQRMITELRAMAMRFQSTNLMVEDITLPLWEKIGVTKEIIEKEFRKMEEEARNLDLPSSNKATVL